jgi:hypothetical protein
MANATKISEIRYPIEQNFGKNKEKRGSKYSCSTDHDSVKGGDLIISVSSLLNEIIQENLQNPDPVAGTFFKIYLI